MVKPTAKQRTFNNGQILNHSNQPKALFDQPGRKVTSSSKDVTLSEDIAIRLTSLEEVRHQFSGVGQKDWD